MRAQEFVRSILDYKSIQSIGDIGNERSGWRDWSEKFKNALNQSRQDGRKLITWMEHVVAKSNQLEREHATILSFDSQCTRRDYDREGFKTDYDVMNGDLYAVLIDKAKGEALKRVREANEGDGLVAYCKVHKWMTEMSMMGKGERTRKLMAPRTAKNEEEVADMIESCEEEVRQL